MKENQVLLKVTGTESSDQQELGQLLMLSLLVSVFSFGQYLVFLFFCMFINLQFCYNCTTYSTQSKWPVGSLAHLNRLWEPYAGVTCMHLPTQHPHMQEVDTSISLALLSPESHVGLRKYLNLSWCLGFQGSRYQWTIHMLELTDNPHLFWLCRFSDYLF